MADEKKEGQGNDTAELKKQLDAAKELKKTRLEQLEIELKIQQSVIDSQIHYIKELGNRKDLSKEDQTILDLAKEKIAASETNLQLLTKQRDVLAEAKQEADNLNDRYKDSIKYIDAMTIGWKNGFAGQIVSSFKNLDKLAARLKKNLTFENIAGSLSETMIQSTTAAVVQVGSLTAEMAKNTGQGTALNGVMNNVASSSRAFGVGFAESAKAVTALSTGMSGFNSMNSNTKAELATTVARLESFGVAAETTTANLDTARQVMGLSTEAAIQMQKDMAALAAGIGMPAGKLAESFKSAAPQLASYGSSMVEVFNDLAITSKKTGIEINDLLGITQQFDTFEGAANAAGKLNAMLGGNLLDSTQLLMANESERLDMIRDSIAASGQSFDSMGRFQKMAIANAMGIKDMAQAERLFSEQARAAQEETDAQAISQEELEKRQKASVSVQQKLTLVMQSFAVAVMPLVSFLNGFLNIIMSINDSLGGFLIPTLIGVIGVMYLLRGATAAVASIKATYLGLTSAGIGLKIKKIAVDKAETLYLQYLYAMDRLRNLSQKEGIVGTIASMAVRAKKFVMDKIETVQIWALYQAENFRNMSKKQSILTTVMAMGLRAKKFVMDKLETAYIYGLILADRIRNTVQRKGMLGTIASMAVRAKDAIATRLSGVASYFSASASNAEAAAKNRSRLATIASSVAERASAAVKYGIAAATGAISSAMGLQSGVAAASVVPNVAAAKGELALGTGAYYAVVPVGLLALALGLLAAAAAVVVYSVLEFVKFLVEAPVRILYALAAFTVLAVGLGLVGIAMQFVGASAIVMGAGLLVMVSQFNAMIPLLPGFLLASKALSAGVLFLAFAFGLLAISVVSIAAGMVAIAVSMASMVKSTAQMVTGSGILEFRSAISGLIDDLEDLEGSMGVLARLSAGTIVMASSMNAVAASLAVMSFGVSLVSRELASMSESMNSMEAVNASFESAMAVATTITPETVTNVQGFVDQAERYTASQIALKSVGDTFAAAIGELASAVMADKSKGAEGDDGKEIVLKIDDRVFGKAVLGHVNKKMNLSMS